MTRVTKRIQMDFNVRAVDQPGNTLLGAVRMSAREGLVNWVYGITGIFYADKDEGLVVFGKEHLFFCGLRNDYDKNALRFNVHGSVAVQGEMPLPENPARFKDKEFAPSSKVSMKSYESQKEDIRLGVLRIPVGQMPLADKQKRLIGFLGEEAEQQLPTLLENLVRRDISAEQPGRQMGIALFSFPNELTVAANQVGSYYLTRKERVEEPAKLFDNRKPRVFSSPTGGLPDWAKDYMRRYRR